MIQNDDDLWLDALAGRLEAPQFGEAANREAAQSTLVLEALALRQFIRGQEAGGDHVSAEDTARELELIARARREGLLTSRNPVAGPESFQKRLRWRMALPTAAVILIAAAGIGVWQSSLKEPEHVRGVERGATHLQALDPAALRHQLTEDLQAAGATVTSYERFGRLGMDVDLPKPLPKAIADILERHDIPIPSNGVLLIEIDAPDSR